MCMCCIDNFLPSMPGSPKMFFPLRASIRKLYVLLLSVTCSIPRPFHPSWYHRPPDICWRLQTTIFLFMLFYPNFSYFLPQRIVIGSSVEEKQQWMIDLWECVYSVISPLEISTGNRAAYLHRKLFSHAALMSSRSTLTYVIVPQRHFDVTFNWICKLRLSNVQTRHPPVHKDFSFDTETFQTKIFCYICVRHDYFHRRWTLHWQVRHIFHRSLKVPYVVGSKSCRPDQLFKVTEIKQFCYFST